jgi:H+/gluconate symporter-like permease
MISASMLLLNLGISIIIILALIMVLKWSPVVALICGSIYMGIASGISLVDTVTEITSGFGTLMAAIGLPIGFGVIIGHLLFDSGGARRIALAMVGIFPGKLVLYGLGITAFVFSIPVFFDVTFVILVPLALALVKEVNKPMPYLIGAMVIGAAAAHTLVPPTPNPLAAAEILGFDLGIMIIAGLFFGLFAALLAMRLLFFLLDKGLWKAEKDQLDEVEFQTIELPNESPGALFSVIPIIIPILMILSGTVSRVFYDTVPGFLVFISNKVIALLAGVIAAYMIASKSLSGKQMEKSLQKAMSSAGLVLLITGAGGSFGAVIESTGIGDTLVAGIKGSSNSALWAILITYLIALIFRVSQGSGTVAGITTMTIMAGAGMAQAAGVHPVWIAMAALSGGISFGHINDSGFWVVTRLSGFSVSGGLKIYTLGIFIISLIVLVVTCLASILTG